MAWSLAPTRVPVAKASVSVLLYKNYLMVLIHVIPMPIPASWPLKAALAELLFKFQSTLLCFHMKSGVFDRVNFVDMVTSYVAFGIGPSLVDCGMFYILYMSLLEEPGHSDQDFLAQWKQIKDA